MALAFTKRDEGEAATTAGAQATASVALAANSLGLVVVALRSTAAPGVNVVSMTSSHGTWVRAAEKQLGFGTNRMMGVFRTMGAGATGVISIQGPSDTLGMTWAVIEVTGVDTSGSNGAGAVNNAAPIDTNAGDVNGIGQPLITISGTPATGDVTFAVFAGDDAESGLTEEALWTNITRFIGTLETSHDLMYSTGQDQTGAWTGVRAGRSWGTAGAIIKVSTGGRTTKNSRPNPLGSEIGMPLGGDC